ncbi:MAG: hypothetical protein K6T80_08470 [Firmicutes bacterium]|nr:hypothetical protein [Bacillota bacterium]
MLFALEVQPIPPSQIVEAVSKTGESTLKIGQGISEPLAVYLVMAAGFVVVLGFILSALGITRKILAAGVLMVFGAAVMFVLTHHPVELVGLVKGGIMSFFSHLKSGG